MQRRDKRDAVPRASRRDRDRVGERTVPGSGEPIKPGSCPRSRGDLQEGLALRGRFQEPFLATGERRRKLGNGREGFVVAVCGGAVSVQKMAASQDTLPRQMMVASHAVNESASRMSPASTAHSSPPEYENAPTG